MFRILTVGFLFIALLNDFEQSRGDFIYSQAPTASPQFLWTSGFGRTGNGYEIAGYWTWDNFSLTKDSSFNQITWRSASLIPNAGIAAPSNASLWAWNIRTSQNQSIAGGSTEDGSYSRSDLGIFSWGSGTVRGYDHQLNLDHDVNLNSGNYMLTIYAWKPDQSFSPIDTWWSSAIGDGLAAQEYWSSTTGFDNYRPVAQDRAFGLSSVPEPSSFLLIGLIAAASTAIRRGVRRKVKTIIPDPART